MNPKKWLIPLVAFGLLFACGPFAPAPADTSAPAAQSSTPTRTPTLSGAATPTPLPPTSTPTPTQLLPSPTSTSTPTSISPSPTPTPTVPLQPAVLGPDEFPPGYDPLTGLLVPDPALLALPPAFVSITNFPVSARPQAGLSSSPWVFELFIGEGMTRFLAMFHGQFPQVVSNLTGPEESVVGPVRSGRLPYESLRQLFNGFLIVAGASAEVDAGISQSANVFGSDESDINSALIDVTRLEGIAAANVKDYPINLSGNLFTTAPPAGGQPAQKVLVFYSFLNQIEWRFDPASGAYLRFHDNAEGSGRFYPHTDRLNGEQLAFENVIVLFAEHRAIRPYLIDVTLFYQFQPAVLFRDGQAYKIYWTTIGGEYEKQTGHFRPIRFVNASGQPFPLHPGQTWVEIVTSNTEAWQIEPGNWRVRFYAP